MKRTLCVLLTLALLLSLALPAMAEGYKIAILTNSVSQNEEEFRAGEKAKADYPDIVITDVMADNFMAEMESTISKLQAFADDPDVKAIIMAQAVPGCVPGYEKIREMGRDDILLLGAIPQEDPALVSAAADIMLNNDEPSMADTIMETCDKWGIDVFVHYSFPRHLAIETIAARRALFIENAEALGIEFVDITAPDPTATEGGIPAAQQLALEDIPEQIRKFGDKKVAFFSTNCALQVPVQAAVLEFPNAYYPQPCCPSPYHGFPSSLGLELNMEDGNEAALRTVAAKLQEHDAVGRYSTWAAPVVMADVAVLVKYAMGYIEGTIEGRNNTEALLQLFEETMPAKVQPYTDAEGVTYDNYYMVLLEPVDFNDYL